MLVASFAGSCDEGTTKGARTNECGVCEECLTRREEEKGKERKRGRGEMAWWVVGSGIAEEEREKAEGGPITGPTRLAPGPVFTLFYPCNRQPF